MREIEDFFFLFILNSEFLFVLKCFQIVKLSTYNTVYLKYFKVIFKFYIGTHELLLYSILLTQLRKLQRKMGSCDVITPDVEMTGVSFYTYSNKTIFAFTVISV